MRPWNRVFALKIGACAIIVATALTAQLVLPELPPFILLFPAVFLTALIGGKWVGIVALLATTLFAALRAWSQAVELDIWDVASLGLFVAGGLVSMIVVDLYQQSLARLAREQHRLKAALEAANAAVWELSPDGGLFWDEHFYRLVGLDPAATPPATPTFLGMIHPEDRGRMAEARRLMDEGSEPRRSDEYRLTRPDGRTVWLENHRIRAPDGGSFIGITQDVTRRKLAEERVQTLLSEAEHRAKNQFMVIMAMARETSRTAETPAAFEEAFGARLRALARSHELMIRGNWTATALRELALAHLEPFGARSRCELHGPDIALTAAAAQYLGMAFHELATNAAKHGSLSSGAGSLRIAWGTRDHPGGRRFELTWTERGGQPPRLNGSGGFGTKVLLQLVPAALDGEARSDPTADGLAWTLRAPLAAIAAR